MSDHPDIKGYYSILRVSQSATRAEIRRAFRERAKELHPDTNKSQSATEEFQDVNEAHRVLSDEKSRSEYDQSCEAFEAEREAERARQRATQQASAQRGYKPAAKAAQAERKRQNPYEGTGYVHCDSCDIVTAQPRYLTYYSVVSYFVAIKRHLHKGVFCRDCADRIALKSSLKTWFAGWWSIPYGPFYTIDALVRNLLGGDRPRNKNVSILWQQAQAFNERGQYDLARACIDQAIEITRDRVDRAKLREAKDALSSGDSDAPKIVNRWGLFGSRAFAFQLMPIMVLLVLALNLTILPKLLNSQEPESQTVEVDVPAKPTQNVFADARSASMDVAASEMPYLYKFIREEEQRTAEAAAKPVAAAPEMLQVGDILMLTRSSPLRDRPSTQAKVVKDLEEDAAVTLSYIAMSRWYLVQTMDGFTGYMQSAHLTRLDQNLDLLNECASDPGSAVQNGDILISSGTGDNVLNIDNSASPFEAVLQLRSNAGALIKSVYVAPYQTVQIEDVPRSELMLWYQTGRDYARRCGRFIENYRMTRAASVYQFDPVALGYSSNDYLDIGFQFNSKGEGVTTGYQVLSAEDPFQ